MSGERRRDRRAIMFVVGASLIALCVAARRLGLGTATDADGPAWWLASMFLLGVSLLAILLLEKLLGIRRNR